MKRVVAGIAVILLIVCSFYLTMIARLIAKQSIVDESRPADVIVVLGAAEYNGRPSPILRSRLNHALSLYLQGYAPYVMTTGGSGGDPVYTEGEVGRGYLTQHGVPSEAILVEPNGSTTVQSLQAATEIMRRMNLHSCIVVSDGYHIFRVKQMLQTNGIEVYGSPRPSAVNLSKSKRGWLYFRQAIGFCLWRLGVSI
jgi:uncharacterized SAM-binding protein YcdF (DUF218 family)